MSYGSGSSARWAALAEEDDNALPPSSALIACWACRYSNPATALACEICETPLVAPLPRVRAAPIPPPPRAPACVCLFDLNPLGSTECVMCGTLLVPPPAPLPAPLPAPPPAPLPAPLMSPMLAATRALPPDPFPSDAFTSAVHNVLRDAGTPLLVAQVHAALPKDVLPPPPTGGAGDGHTPSLGFERWLCAIPGLAHAVRRASGGREDSLFALAPLRADGSLTSPLGTMVQSPPGGVWEEAAPPRSGSGVSYSKVLVGGVAARAPPARAGAPTGGGGGGGTAVIAAGSRQRLPPDSSTAKSDGWACSGCGHVNPPGRAMCRRCSAPSGAKSGWTCPNRGCAWLNFTGRTVCQRCSAARPSGAAGAGGGAR